VIVGTIARLSRYPVKSLRGEVLASALVEARGLAGDRLWCVRTEDGGIGSGKTTRRFRRVDGLLELEAAYPDGRDVAEVTFPDGAVHPVGTAGADAALRSHLGREVAFARETDVMHHDEGPVHVLTTSSLRRLAEEVGDEVDPRRFRANLLLATPGLEGLPETDWLGRRLSVGPEVVLEVVSPMPRCVMVSMADGDLTGDRRVLAAVYAVAGGDLGVLARVVHGGTVSTGDVAELAP
jgi:uncharacterized protein YcbX